jgi:hypothetical protein
MAPMANCKKDNYRRVQLCTTLLKLDKHTNPANHLAPEPQATLSNSSSGVLQYLGINNLTSIIHFNRIFHKKLSGLG